MESPYILLLGSSPFVLFLNLEFRVYTPAATMPNDDHSAAEDRWVRTVVEEIRRFQSLRPRPGRVLRYTPMPPAVRARVNKRLAC